MASDYLVPGNRSLAPGLFQSREVTPGLTLLSTGTTSNQPTGYQAPTQDDSPTFDVNAAAAAAERRAAADAAAAQQREVDYTRSMLDTNLGSLRGLLGNIGQTRDQGVSQYDTTYNNKQVEGNARYGQQETDNMQDRQKALGRVDTNARTAANSLKRLLGLSGSANQSALKFAAPNAISRVASGERQEQLDNFGRNQRNIANEKTSFLDGLKNEYEQGKGNFLRSLFEQENDINAKIGEVEMQKAALNGSNYDGIRAAYAPFQSTIDQNTQRISDIFNQYKPNLKTNANLAKTESYNVDKAAIGANQSMGGDEYSPYSQFLKRKLNVEN